MPLPTVADVEARILELRPQRQKNNLESKNHDHELKEREIMSSKPINSHDKQTFFNHDHDIGGGKISNGAWIFNQVNTHPMLKMAVKSWGMKPELLYRLVEEHGHHTVIQSIDFTRNYTQARVKGAFATTIIRQGGPGKRKS